jgi:two-component system, OmpR family, heavy metal sensor histidine kinase CusS
VNDERPSRSIRRQLTVQILVGTLVLLFVAISIFLGVVHRRLVQDFDRMLEAEAEMLARNAERKGRIIIWDLPDIYSMGSRQNADPAYCQLFLEDGTIAGVSETLGIDNLPWLERRGYAVWDARLPNGRRGRLMQKAFQPVSEDPQMQESPEDPNEQTFEIPATMNPVDVHLVLVVARSRESLDALLGSLYIAGIVAAATLACAITLLVRRAITRGMHPLEEMNARIATITPDSLATRLHVSAPPVELAMIQTTVNRLLDRVEEAFERERRFSSDLAHELRTPIAELRTACDVGERWPDDPENTRQLFRDVGTIALHLEKTVTMLLNLSKCERGNALVQTQRIQLQALVQECWRHVSARAAERRLQFEERIEPALTVESDQDKLEIILRNLLENSVAHSEEGTLIVCSGNVKADGVELRLANTAKDLEHADLDHIFNRFWRKEASRTDRRHIGLGLPIVRALCEVLGLRMRADLTERRIFEVSIFFQPPGANSQQPGKPH